MFKSHLFSIKFLLLANLCTLFDISLSETQKIISKEIPNNTQNSKSSKSICDEHSQCFVSETNINRFRIKDNYVYVGAVNQIFKVGRLKMKHLTGKTTGPVYQSQCYKLPFDIRRNLSPKTTTEDENENTQSSFPDKITVPEALNLTKFTLEDLTHSDQEKNPCANIDTGYPEDNPSLNNPNHVLEIMPNGDILVCNTAFNGICETWDGKSLNFKNGYKNYVRNFKKLQNEKLPGDFVSATSGAYDPNKYKTVNLVTEINGVPLMYTSRTIPEGIPESRKPTVSIRKLSCSALTYDLKEKSVSDSYAQGNEDGNHCFAELNEVQCQSALFQAEPNEEKQKPTYKYEYIFETQHMLNFVNITNDNNYFKTSGIKEFWSSFCRSDLAKRADYEGYAKFLDSKGIEFLPEERNVSFVYMIANKLPKTENKLGKSQKSRKKARSFNNRPVLIRIAKQNIYMETYLELPLKCGLQSFNYVTAAKFHKKSGRLFVAFAQQSTLNKPTVKSAICAYDVQKDSNKLSEGDMIDDPDAFDDDFIDEDQSFSTLSQVFDKLHETCECSSLDINSKDYEIHSNWVERSEYRKRSREKSQLTGGIFTSGVSNSMKKCFRERISIWNEAENWSQGLVSMTGIPQWHESIELSEMETQATSNWWKAQKSSQDSPGLYQNCPKLQPERLNFFVNGRTTLPLVIENRELVNSANKPFWYFDTMIKKNINGFIHSMDVSEDSRSQVFISLHNKKEHIVEVKKLNKHVDELDVDNTKDEYEWLKHSTYDTSEGDIFTIPQLQVTDKGELFYILNSKNRKGMLVKTDVAKCNMYKNCESCMKDTYCGWCGLTNSCTLEKECDKSSEDLLKQTLWINQDNSDQNSDSIRSKSCPRLDPVNEFDPTKVGLDHFPVDQLTDDGIPTVWATTILEDILYDSKFDKTFGKYGLKCYFYKVNLETGEIDEEPVHKSKATPTGRSNHEIYKYKQVKCMFKIDGKEVDNNDLTTTFKLRLVLEKFGGKNQHNSKLPLVETHVYAYNCASHDKSLKPCTDCVSFKESDLKAWLDEKTDKTGGNDDYDGYDDYGGSYSDYSDTPESSKFLCQWIPQKRSCQRTEKNSDYKIESTIDSPDNHEKCPRVLSSSVASKPIHFNKSADIDNVVLKIDSRLMDQYQNPKWKCIFQGKVYSAMFKKDRIANKQRNYVQTKYRGGCKDSKLEFKYLPSQIIDESSYSYQVNFQLQEGDNDKHDNIIFDQVDTVYQQEIYRCGVKPRSNDCSTCVQQNKYNCAWCQDSGTCRYNGGNFECKDKITRKEALLGKNTCPVPGKPAGISVSPKSGPVQGGSKITILGKNLAIEESQVEYIKIGKNKCADISFNSPNNITCTTPTVVDSTRETRAADSSAIKIKIKHHKEQIFDNVFEFIKIVLSGKSISPKFVIVDGEAEISIKAVGITSGSERKVEVFQDEDKCSSTGIDATPPHHSFTNLDINTSANKLKLNLPQCQEFSKSGKEGCGLHPLCPKSLLTGKINKCIITIDRYKKTVENCFQVYPNPILFSIIEHDCKNSGKIQNEKTSCIPSFESGGGKIYFTLSKVTDETIWNNVALIVRDTSGRKSNIVECETNPNPQDFDVIKEGPKLFYMNYTCAIPGKGNLKGTQGNLFIKVDGYMLDADMIIFYHSDPKLTGLKLVATEENNNVHLIKVAVNNPQSTKYSIDFEIENESDQKLEYSNAQCRDMGACERIAGWDSRTIQLIPKENVEKGVDINCVAKMSASNKNYGNGFDFKRTYSALHSNKKDYKHQCDIENNPETPLEMGDYTLQLMVNNHVYISSVTAVLQDNSKWGFFEQAMMMGLIFGFIGVIVMSSYCYMRFNGKMNEQNNKHEVRLKQIEDMTTQQFRKVLLSVATGIDELKENLDQHQHQIPYFTFGQYFERVLFPRGCSIEAPLKEWKNGFFRKGDLSQTNEQLLELLLQPDFFMAVVDSLEQQDHQPSDFQEMASLFSVLLCKHPEKFIEIFEKILHNLSVNYKQKPDNFMRRLVTIQDRILMNFICWSMWSHVTKTDIGQKFYILVNAIRQQQNTGPVDEICGEAMHTLSAEVLLKKDIKYQSFNVSLIVDASIQAVIEGHNDVNQAKENFVGDITLLDVDTVNQAKRKILEVICCGMKYSDWPKEDDIDLQHIPAESRSQKPMLLQENHSSLMDASRIWIMRDFGVREESTITVVKKEGRSSLDDRSRYQSGDISLDMDEILSAGNENNNSGNAGNGFANGFGNNFQNSSTPTPGFNETSLSKPKTSQKMLNKILGSSKNDILDETTPFMNHSKSLHNIKRYHLIKDQVLDNVPVLTKQSRFTDKCLTKIKTGVKRGESSASSKHLLEKSNYDDPTQEFHKLRLVTMRRALEQYIMDTLNLMLNVTPEGNPQDQANIPKPLKYLFDLVDIKVQETGLRDREINHVWKSNCIPNKYWAQSVLTKPENLFDIPPDPISDATLGVVAKTLTDSTQFTEHQPPNKDDDPTVLIAYQHIKKYQRPVRTYYRSISELAPVREPAIIKYMDRVVQGSDIATHFNDAAALDTLWEKYIKPAYDQINCSPVLQGNNTLYHMFSDVYHCAEDDD